MNDLAKELTDKPVNADAQVTVRVPDDVDVDVTLGAPEMQEPTLVLADQASPDAEVFNADFAGAPYLQSHG